MSAIYLRDVLERRIEAHVKKLTDGLVTQTKDYETYRATVAEIRAFRLVAKWAHEEVKSLSGRPD